MPILGATLTKMSMIERTGGFSPLVLVVNKTDLAEAVGADLAVMDRDARKMRGTGPTVFARS